MKQAGNTLRIEVEPGVFLAVEVSGPADGTPVLFSNSLAAATGMWTEVLAHLPEGFRCIRYDTRGHGRSDTPEGPWTLECLSRDVLALMDALDLRRVAFCGLSLGGLSGMWLAKHAPERLASLTLANTAANFPPPSMWEERAEKATAEGMSQFVGPTLQRWFTPRFHEAAPARVAEIGAMIGATPPEGYAGCCRVLAESDLRDALAGISCPTLVIAGAHDASTPPTRADEIRAAVAGSTLVTLDAAHLSAVEAAPAFAAALAAHVQRSNNTNS